MSGTTGVSQSQIAAFAATMGSLAQQAGTALGVNPATILSQWGLESAYGTSNLAVGSNNFGGLTTTGGGFASYSSPQAFEQAYVSNVQNVDPAAVNTGNNASAFVAGLVSGGYVGPADASTYAGGVQGAMSAIQTAAPNVFQQLASDLGVSAAGGSQYSTSNGGGFIGPGWGGTSTSTSSAGTTGTSAATGATTAIPGPATATSTIPGANTTATACSWTNVLSGGASWGTCLGPIVADIVMVGLGLGMILLAVGASVFGGRSETINIGALEKVGAVAE